MGYARIRVTFELLREALGLPSDTEIKSVRASDSSWDACDITVMHPRLKDARVEGEWPPLVESIKVGEPTS